MPARSGRPAPFGAHGRRGAPLAPPGRHVLPFVGAHRPRQAGGSGRLRHRRPSRQQRERRRDLGRRFGLRAARRLGPTVVSASGPGVARHRGAVYVADMRRTMMWRLFALFWAVLQSALPCAALLADVRLERDSQQALGAHVESGSTKSCRPVHPDACALCQVLSRTATPEQPTTLPAIAAIVRPSATLPIARLATRAAATAELPRAPPAIG